MRRSSKASRLVKRPYPLEDRTVSEELNENLRGDPNASQALLRISGLHDWSSDEMRLVDEYTSLLRESDYLTLGDVLGYVIDRYCTYAEDTLERKYVTLSVMLSVTHGSLRMYRLGPQYKNEVTFLKNVFERIVGGMRADGLMVVPHGGL